MSTTPKTTEPEPLLAPGPSVNTPTGQRVLQHTHEPAASHNVSKSWRAPIVQQAKQSLGLSLLWFVIQTVASWLRTVVLAPATVFLDPLSTAVAIFVWPIVFIGLASFAILLRVATALGAGKLVQWIGDTWCDGVSVVNWATFQRVQSARATLSGVSTTFPAVPSPGATNLDTAQLATTRIFDIDVAKAMLAMSSLVYERDDHKVDAAARLAAQGRFDEAQSLVWDAESKIRDQADKWRLRYEGVSDLGTTSGPFASVFYTLSGEEKPWMVLCFKGTTPFNFGEWIVDGSITRATATAFFGDGTAHQGFYTDLFSTTDGGADGYGQIVNALQKLAAEMKSQLRSQEPVQLWVTGHSLGSALAQLCFARFVRSPQDLGAGIKLRDAYTFGTPRIGDGQFASKFDESMLLPRDRPNNLWRVVNNRDIVCRVPPGLADNENNRSSLSSVSMVNFSHIGCLVKLDPWKQPHYTVNTGTFHAATRVVTVKEGAQGDTLAGQLDSIATNRNIVSLVMASFMLPMFYNHAPASYAQGLDRMRPTGEGGEKRRGEKLGCHLKRDSPTA